MTLSMIVTLAIVILMVAVIISDKLPFGAPAILACALLVVTNQADVATAFSGFTDTNVIMVMGFMICTAALQKTTFVYKLKQFLGGVARKGGTGGFIALMLAIMVVGNFISGTAYYVLVISLMATIPYNKNLPTSRILLPATFATGASGWLPTGAAMMIGLIASLCDSAGYANPNVPVLYFCLVNLIWSVVYLVYSTVMHRFLPDRDISDNIAEAGSQKEEKFELSITKLQEKAIYVGYVVLLVDLIFLSKMPGNVGYGLPLLIACIFLALGAISFKEMLGQMFSPVLIMMACVIGVAGAMNNCGLSAYLGEVVSGLLGADPGLLVLTLVFGFATSICATFTGASFGSVFIFAPIGIALCLQYGYNPVPLAFACVKAGWINYFMPIDGISALSMGTGKYKLTEFWLYVIPMWIIHMTLVCILGYAFFK